MPIEMIISAMQDFYSEYGKDKPIEYAYGFFDALSVLRIMQEQMRK